LRCSRLIHTDTILEREPKKLQSTDYRPGWSVVKNLVRPTTGLGDLGMHHISPIEAAKGTLDGSGAATKIYEKLTP